MNWYLEVLKKYVKFAGRARRKEYWMFTLIHVSIFIILIIIDAGLGLDLEEEGIGVLSGVYILATLFPSLAVIVRRLHDTDRSGWWVLASLVPLIGQLAQLVFTVLDSQPWANEHGPNPKGTY